VSALESELVKRTAARLSVFLITTFFPPRFSSLFFFFFLWESPSQPDEMSGQASKQIICSVSNMSNLESDHIGFNQILFYFIFDLK